MHSNPDHAGRVVEAAHGKSATLADRQCDINFASELEADIRQKASRGCTARIRPLKVGSNHVMHTIFWRAMARSIDSLRTIISGLGMRHPESFEIGNLVLIRTRCFLQGPFGGRLRIGNHIWIGAQSYREARDLTLEDYVGCGPGAKVVGFIHTGCPVNLPIIQTDVEIRPVPTQKWADTRTNATLLPRVIAGQGRMAGTIAKDIAAYTVVAGIPENAIRIGSQRVSQQKPHRNHVQLGA